MNSNEVIRELVVALEYLRCACEHSEGRTKADEKRLTDGMCVGIDVAEKHSHLVSDYGRDSFWRDVANLHPTR